MARHAEKDIAVSALSLELEELPPRRRRALLKAMDEEGAAVRAAIPRLAGAAEGLEALNRRCFGPDGFAVATGVGGPEDVSFAAVVDGRRGTCVGLAIVYLALAQRLGLDAHAVATPAHLYIRVRTEDGLRNVELLEGGRAMEDDSYRRQHRIDPASIASGVFLRDLSNAEVIAHLLSNQGVALSRQGRLDAALLRYDAALRLAPQLTAAWYNRGLDLMNAGRLQEALASFSRAIELHPADAQAHNNRGLVRFKLGDAEGARADWKRAMELEPGLKEARENLEALEGGAP